MKKYLILSFLILLTVTTALGCKNKNQCPSVAICHAEIEKSIKEEHPSKAIDLYLQYKKLSDSDDFESLGEIAVLTSLSMAEGKNYFSSGTGLIKKLNDLNNATPLGKLSKKFLTDDMINDIDSSELMIRSLAALNLYLAANPLYTDKIKDYLSHPNPEVRGVTTVVLGQTLDKRYLPSLRKVFLEDKMPFVRYYALKGIAYQDYESVKEEVQTLYEKGNALGKVLAADVLLKEGHKEAANFLYESLYYDDTILKLRALEGLLESNHLEKVNYIRILALDEHFMKSLYASTLLAQSQKPEHIRFLENNLEVMTNPETALALSIALLSVDNKSGLAYIINDLDSRNFTLSLFASRAIIEYNNRHNIPLSSDMPKK